MRAILLYQSYPKFFQMDEIIEIIAVQKVTQKGRGNLKKRKTTYTADAAHKWWRTYPG